MAHVGSLPPDLDRAERVLVSAWTPFPLTVFLIIARLYVRIIRRRFSPDDYFMYIACIFYLANLITLTIVAELGGFRHIGYLKPSATASVSKLNLVSETLNIICAFFAKSSIALSYPRLFGKAGQGLRYFLYLNILLYASTSIASIATEYQQCVPLKAIWDKQLIADGMGSCNGAQANQDVQYLHGAFGAYMDFLLVFIPLTIIFQLRLDWQTRLGTCCLLSLGIFAGVCAILKTLQFKLDGSSDPTWQMYGLALWATLELPLVIIAGCVPPSKPVYDALFRGQPISDEEKFRESKSPRSPSIASFLANLSHVLNRLRGKPFRGGVSRLDSRDAANIRDEEDPEAGAGSGPGDQGRNRNDARAAINSIRVSKTVTVEHSINVPSPTASVEHAATGWYQDPPIVRK